MRTGFLAAALPLALACAAWSAAAQPAPLDAIAAPAPPQGPRAAAGAPLIIEIAEPVSSKVHKRGDMFAIRLAAPLVVGSQLVLPAGATGKGQVIDAAAAGPLGRPAKLLLAARYLEVDGVRLPLRGFNLGSAGLDNTNTIMAASFVPYVGILAGFVKGGEIVIPAGALGQAKLAADFGPPPSGTATPPAPPSQVPQ